MTRRTAIRFGQIAAGLLAVIAAFLGVVALFLLLMIIGQVFDADSDATGSLFERIGWTAFLLLSLAAAVTPFIACNFFYTRQLTEPDNLQEKSRAKAVGWMMAIVALPWWLFSFPVTWDNIVHFQGIAHTLLQTVLTSTPAVLATVCAVCAFRLSGSSLRDTGN